MTVCIAGVFERKDAFLVADQRLTYPNLYHFKSSHPKIWQLGQTGVKVMIAGEPTVHVEAIDAAVRRIDKADQRSGTRIVADMIREEINNVFCSRVEDQILKPRRLSYQLLNEGNVSDRTRAEVAADIARYENEDFSASAIVCGIDEYGPQIYVVNKDGKEPMTERGYAAIGSGAIAARFYLDQMGYHPELDAGAALVGLHFAKKISEIWDGVGDETDIIVLSHANPPAFSMDKTFLSRLDNAFGMMLEVQRGFMDDASRAAHAAIKLQLALDRETDPQQREELGRLLKAALELPPLTRPDKRQG